MTTEGSELTVFASMDGWYFWDEVGYDKLGPYSSSWEAEKQLTAYIMYLDGQHPSQRPDSFTGHIGE